MTATPPPGQPATPAEALRWAAERIAPAGLDDLPARTVHVATAGQLRRWADELDAAPDASVDVCDNPDCACWRPTARAADPGPAAPHPRCAKTRPHGPHNTADSEGAKLLAGNWCLGQPPKPAAAPTTPSEVTPGWTRDNVEALARERADAGDRRADDVGYLLADRDHQHERRFALNQMLSDAWDERDAARAELERLRADHLLIPRAGVVGYRVTVSPELSATPLDVHPADVQIVVRGDLGQEAGGG